ncbi:MAG TPA: Mov34/MPN/PAD-1 family protein [Verrucomicrobiae bacterium]|jgi:proteasome lid subunit RPN8/RPN11|nr:Mov34/MPN/PAD-1 family protein [Verrucomicrobiae bacterium]
MSKAAKNRHAQPVVIMEAEVARQIRQHCRTSMKAEVCGVLIGTIDQDRTLVNAAIPGINAAQGGAHVTFTQDTWEHIYKIKDKEFPDEKIVGWYHSHPGFGVFLSEHDLFIQQNFFSSPQQVAWVFDPHTDEEGCFGWIGSEIEKLSGVRFGYSQSLKVTLAETSEYEDGEDDFGMQTKSDSGGRSREPLWVTWTSRILGYLTALLLGAVLTYMLLHRRIEQQEALTAAQAVFRFEQQLKEDYERQFQEALQRMQVQQSMAPSAGPQTSTTKRKQPKNSEPSGPKKPEAQKPPQPSGQGDAKKDQAANGKQ